MKRLLRLLVILLLLYVGAEVGATIYAQNRLEQEVRAGLPPGSVVDSEISRPLILGLATRNVVDRVEVSVEGVDVGPLVADRLVASAEAVSIDVGRSLRTRRLAVTHIEILSMSVEVTDDQLSKNLPDGFGIRIDEGSVFLETPAGPLKATLVVDRSVVGLIVEGGTPGIDPPSWELADTPLVKCDIGEIRLEPGLAILRCSVEDVRGDFPAD